MIEIDRLNRLAKSLKNYGFNSTHDGEQTHPFDERNIHLRVSLASKPLFDDGHFSQAVFEAFKIVDKDVEKVSGLTETGRALMSKAFAQSKPVVKLTKLSTLSEINIQEGFKFIYTGAITGIRNPRGHDVGHKDTIEDCLDYLVLASILLQRLDERVAP